MRPPVGFLLLVTSSFALPPGRNERDIFINPIYQLESPANLLVEYGPGQAASVIQPRLFLRIDNPTDPTNNLICKNLQNDYNVFFVPPTRLSHFIQNPVSKSIAFDREFNAQTRNMPWIVFLKKESVLEIPKYYRRISLRSGEASDPWELGAYALAPPVTEVSSEYPDEILAAPPPFFPSLCVSPEKPRPFPVLFAPPSPTALFPSLASFSVGDLTPAVVSGGSAVPLAAPPAPVAAPAAHLAAPAPSLATPSASLAAPAASLAAPPASLSASSASLATLPLDAPQDPLPAPAPSIEELSSFSETHFAPEMAILPTEEENKSPVAMHSTANAYINALSNVNPERTFIVDPFDDIKKH